MTYNVKDGGRSDRLDAIVRVIVGQPDLLALPELRGGTNLLRRPAGSPPASTVDSRCSSWAT
jgi:hypothetical protein